MVTMDSIWETTIALSNSTVAVLQSPFLPTKWGPQMHPRTNFATRAAA